MAFTAQDQIDNIREARKHFQKHLEGLKDDQWNWKPYPECKSITDTMAHLLCGDRTVVWGIETKEMPDYAVMYAEPERDPAKLLAMMTESHAKLLAYLETNFKEAPLDTEIFFFGGPMKLGSALAGLCVEESYHTGQVGYIRMASDPEWDYYASVYGMAG